MGQSRLLVSLSLLAIFVAVWTLYGVISAAPAAIHNDMAEAYVWGRQFELGYFQHPPFWAWVAGFWFELFPRTDWAFALLSVVNAGLGLCGAWMLIGDFTDGHRRLAATVLLLLTPFYTFLALNITPTRFSYLCGPGQCISVCGRSIAVGFLTRFSLACSWDWLCLSKYYAMILGATCFVAALVHPARRAYFTSASPYVSLGVTASLFAPHAWWLVRSDAPPVKYFLGKTGVGITSALVAFVNLLVAVVAFHAIVIGLILVTKNVSPKGWANALTARWRDPRFRVLAVLASSAAGVDADRRACISPATDHEHDDRDFQPHAASAA